MTETEAKAPRTRGRSAASRRADRPEESSQEAVPAQADAPRQGGGTERKRSKGNRQDATGQTRGGRQRQEETPAGNLGEVVAPIFQTFSEAALQALEPVIHDIQTQMGRVISQRIDHAVPAIRLQLQQEAQREVRDALQAMAHPGATQRDAAPAPVAADEPPAAAATAEPAEDPERQNSERNDQAQGGLTMATDTKQKDRTEGDEGDTDERTDAKPERKTRRSSGRGDVARTGRNAAASGGEQGARLAPGTYAFSPQGAAQAGLVRLARDWVETGSLYQAIPAYFEILTSYPGTGAAAAATEGLVDLAERLKEQGRFYTALSIFRKLEVML